MTWQTVSSPRVDGTVRRPADVPLPVQPERLSRSFVIPYPIRPDTLPSGLCGSRVSGFLALYPQNSPLPRTDPGQHRSRGRRLGVGPRDLERPRTVTTDGLTTSNSLLTLLDPVQVRRCSLLTITLVSDTQRQEWRHDFENY